MIFASDISKSYSERTLFSGLTLTIESGDRIALIGANGSGKRRCWRYLRAISIRNQGMLRGNEGLASVI